MVLAGVIMNKFYVSENIVIKTLFIFSYKMEK